MNKNTKKGFNIGNSIDKANTEEPVTDDKIITETNIDNSNNNKINEALVLKKHTSRNAKTKAVQLYFSAELVEKIDKMCKQTGMKRSELTTELLNFAISKTKVEE